MNLLFRFFAGLELFVCAVLAQAGVELPAWLELGTEGGYQECQPEAFFYSSQKDFFALSVYERYDVLCGRSISYQDFIALKGKLERPLEVKFNHISTYPLITEFYSKYQLVRDLCGQQLREVKNLTQPEVRERVSRAATLFADILSEEEWGRSRLALEKEFLRKQKLSKEELDSALIHRAQFYSYRLRILKEKEYVLENAASDFLKTILVAYPNNIGKALSIYEESLLPQKTTWGKMSDVYKSVYIRRRADSEGKLCVFNAIREEEFRREREILNPFNKNKKLKKK